MILNELGRFVVLQQKWDDQAGPRKEMESVKAFWAQNEGTRNPCPFEAFWPWFVHSVPNFQWLIAQSGVDLSLCIFSSNLSTWNTPNTHTRYSAHFLFVVFSCGLLCRTHASASTVELWWEDRCLPRLLWCDSLWSSANPCGARKACQKAQVVGNDDIEFFSGGRSSVLGSLGKDAETEDVDRGTERVLRQPNVAWLLQLLWGMRTSTLFGYGPWVRT